MAQAPTPTIALTFSPEFAEVRSDVEVALTFNLHLQAPEMREEAAEGAGRSVVSLSSVLDKSGSMGGQKLALVKRASDFMVTQLGSRDKLGVVQYDSQVNELIPLSRTSAAFKTESKRMIASIEAGSCTNLRCAHARSAARIPVAGAGSALLGRDPRFAGRACSGGALLISLCPLTSPLPPLALSQRRPLPGHAAANRQHLRGLGHG